MECHNSARRALSPNLSHCRFRTGREAYPDAHASASYRDARHPRTFLVVERGPILRDRLSHLTGLTQTLGEGAAGAEAVGMVRAQHTDLRVKRGPEPANSFAHLTGFAQPPCKVAARGEGVGMVWAFALRVAFENSNPRRRRH